ncbi:hypothetical protein YDYSY3_38390 [Paenibacillus chitinolyticus]|uniref:hypothetical protein n=1 Tax=Paenibacillus chitinolyticus TaxID=79263 RepID=UPI0026E4F056|nr:hypothetical protein [Paenibacillus chitinolyticus]GKS12839.1 hypothetical protein YDYSY3_38390 [Paenibacillus chitinolyticus]
MNGIKIFRSKRNETPSTTNITKYPVGTRVSRNSETERIVQMALSKEHKNLNKIF